jgi:transposase
MTQKNTPATTTDHHLVAIDIAKDTLQVQSPQLGSLSVGNDAAGQRQLLKRLQCLENPFVVCEATGGYERSLLNALHQQGIAVALINPSRLRAFALSEGIKAKTDPIDASMILRFAQQKRLTPTPPPNPGTQALAALLDRRSHLTEQQAREKNRLQNSSKLIADSIKRMLRCIEKELAAVDAQIEKLIIADSGMGAKAKTLQSVKGVGKVTTWTILAYLSEMPYLNRNQLVALAGVAPYNRDSGKTSAKRSIFAGRAKVRKCLYMAAQTAAIHNPVIKPYVQGLIARGKPYKCAIVAAMRKLLIHLQSLLKLQQKALA